MIGEPMLVLLRRERERLFCASAEAAEDNVGIGVVMWCGLGQALFFFFFFDKSL